MTITKREQEILRKIYLDTWVCNKPYISNGEKCLVKLHRLGLIRRLKLPNSNKTKITLTDEGLVLAVITCRARGEYNHNLGFSVGFWA
jgi:hypothetical protein